MEEKLFTLDGLQFEELEAEYNRLRTQYETDYTDQEVEKMLESEHSRYKEIEKDG